MGDPADQRPLRPGIWGLEFTSYDERFRREAIAPIQIKFGQFMLKPVIRNILGQVKCKVSLPFILNHQRLFPDAAKQNRLEIGTIKTPCFHRGLVTIKLVAGAGFEPTTFRL